MSKRRSKHASAYSARSRKKVMGGWRDVLRNRWSFWFVALLALFSLSTLALLRVSKPAVVRDAAEAPQLPPLLNLDDFVFELDDHYPRPYLDLLHSQATVPALSDLQVSFDPHSLLAGLRLAKAAQPDSVTHPPVRFPEPDGERLMAGKYLGAAQRPQDFTLSQQMQEKPLETAYFAGNRGRAHSQDGAASDPGSQQKEPCEGDQENCMDEGDEFRGRPDHDRDSVRPKPKQEATVPEPGSLSLLLTGLAALGGWALRRKSGQL